MSLTAPASSTVTDASLRTRADRALPAGPYGHMAVRGRVPASFPQFYSRGEGARLWDADGAEYIDFMCAYGPMIAGYGNAVVDEAAQARQRDGDLLSGPTSHLVELAETLIDLMPHADWAMFAKNGTDATTTATVIARAATGRRTLLKARKAYHGANPWFTPVPAGVTAADRADIIEFDYNDLASLEAAAARASGDVAAIILTPFRHDGFVDQDAATPEFAQGARALADRVGAALILDEVRTTYRMDLRGAWESYGVRPDLTAMSKALANGYPLSAVVGSDALREGAGRIFVTGSFWMASSPMAAAMATLGVLQDGGFDAMTRAGRRLREGLQTQAEAHGFTMVQTGPVTMPFFRFENDEDMSIVNRFTDAAVRRGVLLHPWHNMFVSAAHTDDDIADALARTDEAFAELRSTS
ncbi:aminotransferase class III-fold pyridoxal phosphate-dependent enzyme [Microbacterium sp. NPDC091313]